MPLNQTPTPETEALCTRICELAAQQQPPDAASAVASACTSIMIGVRIRWDSPGLQEFIEDVAQLLHAIAICPYDQLEDLRDNYARGVKRH